MTGKVALALLLCVAACMHDVDAANPESEKWTQRGIAQSEPGSYRSAVALFTRAIEADATNAQAWHERGMARLELDQDREAVADFEQALKLDPKFPGARPWLARTLTKLGDHRHAAEAWLQHIRSEPMGDSYMGVSPLHWSDCAEQFQLAGEQQRAIELLEEYFAKYASHVTKYLIYETSPMRELAKLYDQAGQPEKAAKMRKRALASKHKVPADET